MLFNFLIALYHMPPESNNALCFHQFAKQSVFIPEWSQQVSTHKDYFVRLNWWESVLSRQFKCNATHFLALDRWVASGGDNKVCSCCETSCSEQRRKRSLGPDAGTVYRSNTTLHSGLNTEHLVETHRRIALQYSIFWYNYQKAVTNGIFIIWHFYNC